jgi:hypothetical protein
MVDLWLPCGLHDAERLGPTYKAPTAGEETLSAGTDECILVNGIEYVPHDGVMPRGGRQVVDGALVDTGSRYDCLNRLCF